MDHPLSCACGTLKGALRHPGKAGRGICYCKDCQAFARFLGKPGEILDPMGGTDVVATLGQRVTISEGREALACMSLSPKGTLRWYASCCNTPIGNTLRNYRLPYVGLVHSCLESAGARMDDAFGPSRMRVNTGSAIGNAKPQSTPLRTAAAVVRVAAALAGARVTGGYRRTPFFDTSGEPVVQPTVLTREERARSERVSRADPAAVAGSASQVTREGRDGSFRDWTGRC